MKGLALLLLLLNFSSSESNLWRTLSKVEFKTRLDESTQFEIEYPVFSEEVQSLDGQIVEVSGYIIPLEELTGQNHFVLSDLPFNLCYFCGSAGPETVMEVNTKKSIPYTSDRIWMRGRLKLNPNDPDHLIYIMDEAVQIKQ